MKINDYELVKTSDACPEQYDVYRDGANLGYLRLRHSLFTAQLYGPWGPEVYRATPKGDGLFEPSEREGFLTEAVEAIGRAV
jgi:hypothetical protein